MGYVRRSVWAVPRAVAGAEPRGWGGGTAVGTIGRRRTNPIARAVDIRRHSAAVCVAPSSAASLSASPRPSDPSGRHTPPPTHPRTHAVIEPVRTVLRSNLLPPLLHQYHCEFFFASYPSRWAG